MHVEGQSSSLLTLSISMFAERWDSWWNSVVENWSIHWCQDQVHWSIGQGQRGEEQAVGHRGTAASAQLPGAHLGHHHAEDFSDYSKVRFVEQRSARWICRLLRFAVFRQQRFIFRRWWLFVWQRRRKRWQCRWRTRRNSFFSPSTLRSNLVLIAGRRSQFRWRNRFNNWSRRRFLNSNKACS